MNMPARYCTGYLGDIGAPPPYGPMDFAAWFEAYLDGTCHVFDPRKNVPRIGRVLMARRRGAVDVAISNTFGPNIGACPRSRAFLQAAAVVWRQETCVQMMS
jgi:transglutaminase-like putative cysteine protease